MTRPEVYLELYGNGVVVWAFILVAMNCKKKSQFLDGLLITIFGSVLWPVMVFCLTITQMEENI